MRDRGIADFCFERDGTSLPGLGLTELVAQYLESDPVPGSAAAKA